MWSPLGARRDREKALWGAGQAMDSHHPKSDPLFAQRPVLKILGEWSGGRTVFKEDLLRNSLVV
jgi:hypothetical protein